MIGGTSRQQLSRENELLRSLQRLGGKLLRRTDKEELLQEILRQASDFMNAPNAAISLVEPDGETLRLCYGLGLQAGREGFRISVTAGLAGEVWRTGRVQIIEDYRSWPGRLDIPELARLSTIIMAPLKAAGKVVGMIQIAWNDEVFPVRAAELNVLDQFALMASQALENSLLFQTAQTELRERRETEAALQRERAFSRAVIDSIPGIFFVYDEQGQLIRWNKQQEVLTGYTADEIRGRSMLEFFGGNEQVREALAAAVDRVRREGAAELRLDLNRRDGSLITMYFTTVGLTLDGKRYLVGIGTDISKIREAEDSLRSINETLETKVAERTQELNGLNQELTAMNMEMTALNEELTAMNESLLHANELLQKEVADRLKAEQDLTESLQKQKNLQEYLVQSEKMAALGSLVAGVAHEVNTPVGVGVTAASHLREITQEFKALCAAGSPRRSDLAAYLEDAVEAADIVLKNLDRAGKLIKSFKQVSADQSSEARRRFKVRDYLGEILLSLNPQLKKTAHQVTVECDDSLEMDGYPGAFAQVIANLVMNSLKHAYGPEAAGRIRIELTETDGMAELRYSDDGRGIEPTVLPKIFDPFFTTKRGEGGTGLGLSVVYNIVVQQFGGTITCDSALGQGAMFTLRFPLQGK